MWKLPYSMIFIIYHSKKGKVKQIVTRLVVARVQGAGRGGMNGWNTKDSWGSETILCEVIDGRDMSLDFCQSP